jgi:hypothetical protein
VELFGSLKDGTILCDYESAENSVCSVLICILVAVVVEMMHVSLLAGCCRRAPDIWLTHMG